MMVIGKSYYVGYRPRNYRVSHRAKAATQRITQITQPSTAHTLSENSARYRTDSCQLQFLLK